MGVRKRNRAEILKEARQNTYFAKLNNCPTSPRKMRLVADMIRGTGVESALHNLKHSSKEASRRLYKLLLSAIANWQNKNEDARIEESNLFVSEIFVDSGRQLKRIRTAPQGRAHRIRKRSNHVTLVISDYLAGEEEFVDEVEETPEVQSAEV
jgi:large subunit ribosomal protein L22